MSNHSIPKRSHSLMHHKQHSQQSKLSNSSHQQKWLQQQPTSTLSPPSPTHLARSASSVTSQQQVNRLARSSSLSHHSNQIVPIKSKSLTQKSVTRRILPPPSTQQQPPFQFLQHEPQQQKSLIIPPRRSSSLKKTRKKSMNPNEEVTKALLEWKHKSIFKVDWANMFSPSVELWKMNDNIFGSIEDLLNYKNKNTKQEVEKAVHLLWLEDEQFIPKKEIAAYLGKLNPFCHLVLKNYIDKFDFTLMKLDEAFRKLCSKLYFKAEAQEIDRILEVFSHKYWNDNKNDIELYKSADVVYTITYSIMLLNTDLHLVQISSHTKMTSAMFCENTVATIMDQNISISQEEVETWKVQLEGVLKSIFTSVKYNGILQPMEDSEPKSFLKRMGSLTQKKKRSTSFSSHRSQ